MTYCLAISVNKGLVFASDSRTNAGVDYVTTYSKMHSFVWPGERVCVLLTAGNLATSQAVVNNIKAGLEAPDTGMNLRKGKYLHEVAHYVGQLSQAEQREHAGALEKSGNGSAEASFILGGQIAGLAPEIYLIYPQGNYISASPETPYLQIGENKYGKPILDRIIIPATSLEDAARCALVSLESTIRSNISVGPPLELAIHTINDLNEPVRLKLTLNSPMYKSLQKQWNESLRQAFNRLPRFDWE
ncbi:peptidase [Nitrosomonas sp.]|uniref:peptidase n=1 Tax=Nitrosomonas sp. TaxID=42353 RepID=UPI001DFF1566|nr:peptidase [Nitrosomonas sp.]MCB1948111.1 peptidase [Nitrosomonas sp.]MCP5242291.1 peptidase [Burkholderiales bacterium]MDR4514793.1 peptidase [Nitrosomonas sp.]